eukprot:GHUV01002059.1.p1 GENE.GHUV01002059.1~~GHUV01002059.1.p1  ORF type:complete len:161 (+),score=42.51 GHUV01002059.1:129-611(+)
MLALSSARLQRCAAFKPAAAASTSRRSLAVLAKKTATKEPATATSTDADVGPAGLAAIAAGLVCNPVMLYSEYVLKTTGAGLPPGPGGIFGALEGISYLVVLGIIAWSVATKVKTGSGLPAGPSGLLGAVEGVSYLSLLGGIVVFGLQIAEKGSLPGIFG